MQSLYYGWLRQLAQTKKKTSMKNFEKNKENLKNLDTKY